MNLEMLLTLTTITIKATANMIYLTDILFETLAAIGAAIALPITRPNIAGQ